MHGIKNIDIGKNGGIDQLKKGNLSRASVFFGQSGIGELPDLFDFELPRRSGGLEAVASRFGRSEAALPLLTTLSARTKTHHARLKTHPDTTRSQENLIKSPNRNHVSPQRWNLDAEYLEPLKSFPTNTDKKN